MSLIAANSQIGKGVSFLFPIGPEDSDLTGYLNILCNHIDRLEPIFNVFVPETYSRDLLMTQARELIERFPDSGNRPPLFGVPVGVKDIFRCDGSPTRCGSNLPPELFQGAEARSVELLRKAGALIIGKTVTTEFAFFEPGNTRNPHNIRHTPGGSSSGSAAGVAAGFFPLSLGTQTVGSVIRPASYCGVVGFKPSLGRISTEGVIPFSTTVDHVGIFSQTPRTLSVLLRLLSPGSGEHPSESVSSSLTLGIPEGPYLSQASAETLLFFKDKLRRLIDAGYRIREVNAFKNIEKINERHNRLIAGEIARVHQHWFDIYKDLYRPRTARIIQQGMKESDTDLVYLRTSCLELRNQLHKQMEKSGIDLWISPSTVDTAPQGITSTGSPLMNLPWTHSGLPTISLPAGFRNNLMPQGIQVTGRFMEDEKLLAAAVHMFDIWSEVASIPSFSKSLA